MYSIRTKRIYEAPDVNDGIRILVDRLWPRGIKKESAAINAYFQRKAGLLLRFIPRKSL